MSNGALLPNSYESQQDEVLAPAIHSARSVSVVVGPDGRPVAAGEWIFARQDKDPCGCESDLQRVTDSWNYVAEQTGIPERHSCAYWACAAYGPTLCFSFVGLLCSMALLQPKVNQVNLATAQKFGLRPQPMGGCDAVFNGDTEIWRCEKEIRYRLQPARQQM